MFVIHITLPATFFAVIMVVFKAGGAADAAAKLR